MGAAWIVLLGLASVVLFPNLSYPLIEPDETRYAQIALEMVQSRDWVTPTLGGQAYLDKPPLMYWLTATSFSIFGPNVAAARLPSILSAMATVVLWFAWGRRVLGDRAAWLGAVSLTLCGGFVVAGRFLILDSLLTLFTTACLLAGYIALREDRTCWRWWMTSATLCALGILAKGPVALVLCVPILIANGWLCDNQTRPRWSHWVMFSIPVLVICVPWYFAVATFNPEFVDYFFWEHNFKRFTEGSNHREPFWFYIPVVFAAMFPSSLLLPSAIVFLFRRRERSRLLRSKDLGFLACGSAWILFFFSVSSCKLPPYILPSLPLLAGMLGVMLDQTVLEHQTPCRLAKFLRPFPQRATMILALACFAVIAVDTWIGQTIATRCQVAAVLCVAAFVVAIVLRNRPVAFGRSAWWGTTCVATVVLWLTVAQLVPTIARDRSALVETRKMASSHPDATIVFFGEKPYGARFHLSESATVYFPVEMKSEFVGFLRQQGDVVLVTDDFWINRTQAAVCGTHRLVASTGHKHVYFGQCVSRPVASVVDVQAGVKR
ncbi:ArnT family glycosyltransferase [Roseiconus nitratireducens]|uniref:ArnT family glycosyltransferase n=1 Tax=Roseiconus nitratireducens TaxID=2605748 RepID=UPI0013759830|nr:glycosyltransferase family 39 protein [Roseiconus nitratireducens]